MRKATVLKTYNGGDPEFKKGERPEIRLRGHWLSILGFSPGDKLKIDCQDNMLIVRKEGAK